MEYSQQDMFSRSQMLLGDEVMERLRQSRVIVFGIGGVGSWAAEALIRTGLVHLTIVDADRVALSNINRQAPATSLTIGAPKVEALRQRLLQINPMAKIDAVFDIYSPDTAANFSLEDYDYVIDAIDSLRDKALLINNVTRAKRPRLFSSMGAALKLDPTRIQVAEFWNVKGCRLAAALRHKFNHSGIKPARKFKCVFSDELIPNHAAPASTSEEATQPEPMSYGKVAFNGSLCHITAIFGMTLAGLVISNLRSRPS